MDIEEGITTPPAPPPGEQGGESGNGQARMIPEERLTKALAGKGKEVERAQKERDALAAKLAKLEAAAKQRDEDALAEQGKYRELYEAEKAKAVELEKAHNALAERETERLEQVTKRNQERMKALPEHFRALMPSGITPDAASEQLSKLEALAGSPASSSGAFATGPRPAGAPLSAEQELEELNQRAADVMLGRKPTNVRGVTR